MSKLKKSITELKVGTKTDTTIANQNLKEQLISSILNPPGTLIKENSKLIELENRIANDEKISIKEIDNLKKDIERKRLQSELELAKGKPLLDKIDSYSTLKQLTKLTDCEPIAANANREMKSQNVLEQMLVDQMTAIHTLSMRWLEQVHNQDEPLPVELGNKVINTAMRMMETYQKGAITLHRLRNGNQQTVIVKHQHVQIEEGGQALITDEFNQGLIGGASKK
jgi:hypothetical protein